jgi:hypothetical protein
MFDHSVEIPFTDSGSPQSSHFHTLTITPVFLLQEPRSLQVQLHLG